MHDGPIDLAALRSAEVHAEPFWWAFVPATFQSRETALGLQRAFPSDGYTEFFRAHGAKRHHLYGRKLVHPSSGPQTEGLSGPWPRLVEQLHSREYRDALAELTGISLDALAVEVTLWRQSRGGFIDPHPDNPDKVLVHLMYLSDEDWSVGMGGCMRLLRSSDIEDVAFEIPPRLSSSIVFVRTDRSWHGYRPVTADRPRFALQVVFHHPQMSYSSGY
jgi:hypothetical protein